MLLSTSSEMSSLATISDSVLAYVYLATDGAFVNLAIVRQGYARVLTIRPNAAHADEFVAAAGAAQADNIGLWANCTG